MDDLRSWLQSVMADAPAHVDPRDLTGLDETFERRLVREAGERGWLALEGEARAAFNFDSGWELRGTKVLVTGAHKADWCVTLAASNFDVPAREGMSMFLVDMREPGVRVVRRPTMNGWDLGDIYFEDAPAELLGARDGGWRQLVTAVAAERSGMFWLGFARHVLDLLVEHVRAHDDVLARDALGRVAADWSAAERLCWRVVSGWLASARRRDPRPHRDRSRSPYEPQLRSHAV